VLAFDASAMIHAWDHYPIAQFPRLWEWMKGEVDSQEFAFPRIAMDEIGHKLSECFDWINDCDVRIIAPDNAIVQQAFLIKQGLGIMNDQWHPKGVDENDVMIIASAGVHGAMLVSNEGRQTQLPPQMARFKIPAVCDAHGVVCVSFIQLVKQAGRVFG